MHIPNKNTKGQLSFKKIVILSAVIATFSFVWTHINAMSNDVLVSLDEVIIATVEKDLGPIDILVNNAGITRDAPLKRMQPQQWQDVMRTNLDSMYNMCQPVFDAMCNQGFGRIVNISSLNGEQGQFGQANYSAAKAGIYGFTKAIAKEGARKGVTVNAVSPGFIDTPMVRQVPENVLESIVAGIPVGRLGLPEEISRAVAFLTADDAGYITGTNLSVNGGEYMS